MDSLVRWSVDQKKERDEDRRRKPGSQKLLSPGTFEALVRPSMRPVGLMVATFPVVALVSILVKAIAPGKAGALILDPLSSLAAGVAGKALAILLIFWIAGDDFGVSRLLSKRKPLWLIMVGISAGTGFLILEIFFDSQTLQLFDTLSFMARFDRAGLALSLLPAALFGISGALEELLFRGIVQSSCEAHFRPLPAIVYAAVIFAVPHAAFGWIAVLELFVVGLALSWYRASAGSLALPITIHATHNLLFGLLLGLSL